MSLIGFHHRSRGARYVQQRHGRPKDAALAPPSFATPWSLAPLPVGILDENAPAMVCEEASVHSTSSEVTLVSEAVQKGSDVARLMDSHQA